MKRLTHSPVFLYMHLLDMIDKIDTDNSSMFQIEYLAKFEKTIYFDHFYDLSEIRDMHHPFITKYYNFLAKRDQIYNTKFRKEYPVFFASYVAYKHNFYKTPPLISKKLLLNNGSTLKILSRSMWF
jgi:hypothetical protein